MRDIITVRPPTSLGVVKVSVLLARGGLCAVTSCLQLGRLLH